MTSRELTNSFGSKGEELNYVIIWNGKSLVIDQGQFKIYKELDNEKLVAKTFLIYMSCFRQSETKFKKGKLCGIGFLGFFLDELLNRQEMLLQVTAFGT